MLPLQDIPLNIKTYRHVLWITIILLGSIYLSTLQTINNGSKDPYATDVGEIQNALPRWGTVHFSGYPQYTFLGSAWTELLSWFQFSPATATSLFSLLWGLLTYIYLPIREWLGAEWLFSNPGTWEGFRALVLDTKSDRIVEVPATLAEWRNRVSSIWGLLRDDWPLLFLVAG